MTVSRPVGIGVLAAFSAMCLAWGLYVDDFFALAGAVVAACGAAYVGTAPSRE